MTEGEFFRSGHHNKVGRIFTLSSGQQISGVIVQLFLRDDDYGYYFIPDSSLTKCDEYLKNNDKAQAKKLTTLIDLADVIGIELRKTNSFSFT